MGRWVTVLLAGTFLAFPAPQAYSQDSPQATMTLEKVLRQVYRDNPTLEASRYGLKATHELYPQALSGWHPVIGAEASVTSSHIDTDPDTSVDGATTKSGSINIEQPLYKGGRTTAETESAKSRIKAGYNRMLQTEQDVFLRTVQVYMDVIRDRTLLSYQNSNRQALAQEQDSLQARLDAGDVTSTDVKRAQARLAEADALVVRAQGDLHASEAAFQQVTGLLPPAILIMPAPNFPIPPTQGDMLALAEKNNPQLYAAKFDHLAAQSDIGAAESDKYPQVSAFAYHITDFDPQPGDLDRSSTDAIGVRARINLYEGGKTMSQIREAKDRANQRYIQIVETERAVRDSLIENWNQLQAYKAEISSRELAVTAADASRQGVREEAKQGERTTVETLDAERDMLESQVALANATHDMMITQYRLAEALGLLLPEHMGMADIAWDPGPHFRAVSHRIFSEKED